MTLNSHNRIYAIQRRDSTLNCLTVYEDYKILRWMLGQTPQHPLRRKTEKAINVSSRM